MTSFLSLLVVVMSSTKRSMDNHRSNEMHTPALHENSILHIKSKVAIRLHPRRDVLVPSAGSLQGTIYALEKL